MNKSEMRLKGTPKNETKLRWLWNCTCKGDHPERAVRRSAAARGASWLNSRCWVRAVSRKSELHEACLSVVLMRNVAKRGFPALLTDKRQETSNSMHRPFTSSLVR